MRSLSTSSIASQMVKPPLQIFGLEGRYATALYSAASKQKVLEKVEKELVQIQSALKTDKAFKEFTSNPTIKNTLKADALKAAAAKFNFSAQSTNFLELLAENGRLKKLDSVINAFKLIMSAHRGEVRKFTFHDDSTMISFLLIHYNL